MRSDTDQFPGTEKRGPEDSRLVFVYGSLKRGYALHEYLRQQQFVGEVNTQPFYRLYDCGAYPALVKAEHGGVAVRGELFRVSAACLKQLDDAEGVPEGLYERDIVLLQNSPAEDQALAYFYLQPTVHLKDCGPSWP